MQNNNNDSESGDSSPENKESTGTSTSATPAQAKPKRHQAQRACSNCKRLHARCDNERPCKRCTQNGLASTCMDIPRKRRMSRTYTEVWETRFNNGSSSSTTTTHSVAVTNSPHIITPNAWGTAPPISKSPTMMNRPMMSQPMMVNPTIGPGMVPIMGTSPYDPSILLSEIVNPNEEPTMMKHGYPEFGSMGPTGPLYEKQDPLVESFLYHQMHELSHIPSTPTQSPNLHQHLHNPSIAKTYSSSSSSNIPSTPSLHDLEVEFNTGNVTLNSLGQTMGGRMESGMTWNSIVPQQEFAISVWKGTNTPGLNYLVECNDRFLSLVGFSIDTLKNNFPCQKLFISKAFSSQKDWPKRTQISTAYGYKDVYLTIYPLIGDVSANKYFIVNMLELSPLPKMDNNMTANLTYASELKDTMNVKTPQSYELNANLKHEILRASSMQ